MLHVGDFYDSVPFTGNGAVADLMELVSRLNGQIVLIKGNHDKLDDSVYRPIFSDVVEEMRIDELNLRLIHNRDDLEDRRPGERVIYGHEHRCYVQPPTTRDSICVCAKWHGWKPITLAEAIRQMDACGQTPA